MGGRSHKRSTQYWREILHTIRCANAYSNANCNPNADAVRGEMYADAEAAPHSLAAAQSLRPESSACVEAAAEQVSEK